MNIKSRKWLHENRGIGKTVSITFLRSTTIWHFDKTDMKEVRKHLQGWACFSGNFPSSLLKTGTVDQVKAHARQLLDDLAAGGGYYVVNGAVLDETVPENLHAYVDTVKGYKL